jgi:hypothetical protein
MNYSNALRIPMVLLSYYLPKWGVKGRAPEQGSLSSTLAAGTALAPPETITPRYSGPSTVAINFGIDFGTSFTKVCFRDVSTEESSLVTLGTNNGVIPSNVAITGGRLNLQDDTGRASSQLLVPYLKMRLARSPIGQSLPTIDGIDLNDHESTCALASWFLGTVIVRSQQWMFDHERDRLKNKVPIWSANVGVPVEHYDSEALETFRSVLGVAWLWAKHGSMPSMRVPTDLDH